MAFDTNNLVLHIRRLVHSSIRLGYHFACDYPVVLGAGILVLFLQRVSPSIFAFLLSSSPVFVLTALLLGTLLSYGEPAVPFIGEETLQNQETLSLKPKISTAQCSVSQIENIAVEARLEKTTETDNGELYVGDRASDDRMSNALCEEKMVTHIAADTVLSGEVYVEEERTSNDNLHDTHCEEKNVTFMAADTVLSAEYSKNAMSDVIVERKEDAEEINEVHNHYQLGEFMRSCWQPVMRRDLPGSDSESDLTDDSSSPDASMTDIIPMLEELHPLINLGNGQPPLASRDNLNSSSDDYEDDLEEEDISSEEGEEGQKDDGNDWKDVTDINSLDMSENGKMENLMELQRTNNILKFELDKRLMDLQAADATQKLKEASSFHVQVPSISTLRQRPFDHSEDSEETVELPQIPGSAPSVFLQRRNLFDLSFDRIVDHGSRFQETWTPRSYFQTRQHRKQRNSYGQWHSTYLQHQNGIKLESGEICGRDACDGHSDDNVEQEGNNGKLFGSLEAHLGEEIKILSAAISDVGLLEEVNYRTDEGNKNGNITDDINSFPITESVPSTSEASDSVVEGDKQSTMCSRPGVNNSEPHVVEANFMSEVNSLFKCRMEDMLVQSISERSVGQPLTVKPEDGLSVSLSPDSWMHVHEASSVQELNSRFARLDEEALQCAASDSTCHNVSIRDRSSEASPMGNEHNSELPTEEGSRELLAAGDQQTLDISEADSGLHEPTDVKLEAEPNEPLSINAEVPVLEASSVEEMNSLSKQLEEEAQLSNVHMSQDREPEADPMELTSGLRFIDAETLDETSSNSFRVTELSSSAGQTESTSGVGQPAEDV